MTRRRPRVAQGELGSATVLAVGLIAVLLIAMAGGLVVARAVAASARAAAAADQAALAGAHLLQSSSVSAACATAAGWAVRNGAVLTDCSAEGTTLGVAVRVPSGLPGFGPARATARAGPAREPP